MLSIIGLMSGTSADGIDASLVHTDGQHVVQPVESLFCAYERSVQQQIQLARQKPADYLADPQRRTALIDAITRAHAKAVSQLRQKAGQQEINLIGFHGQTVYHNPEQCRTIQLGDGPALSRMTACPVIYDFRHADMAAGGQGAPLAPIYHQLVLRQAGFTGPAAFINIGGVSNLSFCAGEMLIGYDIGPGNALMDDLCMRHFKIPFDKDGKIAAGGQLSMPFINLVMADPFFSKTGPRALDRAHFHKYLESDLMTSLSPEDQIASVTALTAHIIVQTISKLPQRPEAVIFAGGGAHNKQLMAMIASYLPENVKILPAEQLGSCVDLAEAELIAVLAARYHYNLPSSFPGTTGVSSPQICGIRTAG